jgi:hypothetical protein
MMFSASLPHPLQLALDPPPVEVEEVQGARLQPLREHIAEQLVERPLGDWAPAQPGDDVVDPRHQS